MKKFILLIVTVLMLFNASLSQNPVGHYKIDLKTKFSDKSGLKSAKHGFKKILQQQTWCDVGEVGEDFAVWVKSPLRDSKLQKNGNKKVQFSCKLEIRKKSMFKEGDLMHSRSVDFTYEIDKKELDEKGDIKYVDISRFVESVIETSKSLDDSKMGKIVVGLTDVGTLGASKATRIAIEKFLPMFQPYFSNGEPLEYKAEFYFVGGELLRNLKEMVVELEAPRK